MARQFRAGPADDSSSDKVPVPAVWYLYRMGNEPQDVGDFIGSILAQLELSIFVSQGSSSEDPLAL